MPSAPELSPNEIAITLNMLPKLGSVKIRRLFEFFGTPELVLHAPKELLAQVPGISPSIAETITQWSRYASAKREQDRANKEGVTITTIFDDNYPASLRQIYDPPIVLYSLGNWIKQDEEQGIGVVGSRLASHYGLSVAKRLSYELAQQGITIISGLARGIDTQAHQAALAAGGRTVAILGFGLLFLPQQDNANLAQQIVQGGGAIVSEFPLDLIPSKSTFPMRNRVISGWSQATLVIEAGHRSGALITASQAADQGRRVFAVPGPIDRPHSVGANMLIRDGATLVLNSQQIIDDMGWNDAPQLPQQTELPLPDAPASRAPKTTAPTQALTEEEKGIISAIKQGSNTIDSLCLTCGCSSVVLAPMLARLQIIRAIRPTPGGGFAL